MNYERALQLNPNYSTAHQWFANDSLANVGQNERELTEMKRAIELDPLSLVINSNLGWAYIHLGAYSMRPSRSCEKRWRWTVVSTMPGTC